MLKNYFKIAWRNLYRGKSFSILNIIGLSIGLTVSALILIWVNFEMSIDQFHVHKNRIYEVYNQYPLNGEIQTWISTPKVMGPTIQKDYPEVESVVRMNWEMKFLFSTKNTGIYGKGNIVDPNFLNVFNFPLIKGNQKTVLSNPNSVVITQFFAKKIFGDKSAIGKIIKIDNKHNCVITGVLKKLPPNTSFEFDFLMPWSYLRKRGWDDKDWSNNGIVTYVILKKGVNHTFFSNKIKSLRKSYDKDRPEMLTRLYPFTRSWLHSNFKNGKETGGRIALIRMFSIIAFIILIIACINFMNLSTARSEKRAKEVGVRKVLGANRKGLIIQFIGESMLVTLIAGIFAFILVLITLPHFSTLVEKPLSLDITNTSFWLYALGITLLTGFLAGSYPALFLSKFKSSIVLKGTFNTSNTSINPRKILVIFQFTTAIILISSSIIIIQQLKKVQNRNTGYSKSNLIYNIMRGTTRKKYSLIKEELLTSGAVISVTKTYSPITEGWSESDTWRTEWKGKSKENKTIIKRFNADDALTKTLGFKLVKGRDFDLATYPTDSTAVIINESAVALMNFKKPIGQVIKDEGIKWHVVGVIKDFIMESPFQNTDPIIIKGAKSWFNVINIKLNENYTTSESLSIVKDIFKKHNPKYPFDYEFVDKKYAAKFNDEKTTTQLIKLFTVLAIFISCIGLFGLASYMAENRIKEIGVRRVSGASIKNITVLLTKDFLKLVLVSILLAIPISWYLMSKWLESFAYRITISWWVFLLSGILALIIAFCTVVYQAIKASLENPIKSLKTE